MICTSNNKCKFGKVPQNCSGIFITGRNEVVAKVIFLHLFVILFTGGEGVCLSGCWDTTTPPPRTRQTPPDQADTPTPDQTPPPLRIRPPLLGPGRHPPGPGRPPREADSSIRSTSGRYASYWNAFLLNRTKMKPTLKGSYLEMQACHVNPPCQ